MVVVIYQYPVVHSKTVGNQYSNRIKLSVDGK